MASTTAAASAAQAAPTAGSILAHLRAQRGFLDMQEVPGFPGLFIGPAVAARSPANLARLSHVLTVNGQPPLPPAMARLSGVHLPCLEVIDLEDDTEQDILAVLPRCLQFIDAGRAALYDPPPAHARPAGVLVHCTLGVSRSAAVVAAYIMARARVSLPEALVWLRAARPWVRPNDGFLEQLARFGAASAHSRCDLCALARVTRWYAHGHPAFAVLQCDSCDAPLAVLREHGTPWAAVPPAVVTAARDPGVRRSQRARRRRRRARVL